jgi:ribosomal protein L29
MKAKELNQKSDKELREMLNANRFELGQLKFDSSSKKIKNVKQIGELRKDIARIMTILNIRQQKHE